MSELNPRSRGGGYGPGKAGRILVWLSLVALVFPAAAAAPQVGGDTIHMRDGNPRVGVQVLKEGCDEIVFKLSGSRQTVPTTSVVDVVYGNSPSRFSMAKNNLKAGKYAKALEGFDMVLKSVSENSPEWLKIHCLYLKGEALLRMAWSDSSRYGQAAETLEKLLAEKAAKKHRLEPWALQSLGDAQLGAGETDNAKATFATLEKTECPGAWDVFGKFGQGLIFSKGGDYSQARSLFADVVQKAGIRPEAQGLVARARLELGRAWLAEDSFQNAMDEFNKLIRAAGESLRESPEVQPLLAAAYNGLGDSFRGRAAKFKKSEDHTEAVIAYMHVVTLFQTPERERRHALLYAGKSCEAVGWQDKAKDLYDELKSFYPNSKEAKEAGN